MRLVRNRAGDGSAVCLAKTQAQWDDKYKHRALEHDSPPESVGAAAFSRRRAGGERPRSRNLPLKSLLHTNLTTRVLKESKETGCHENFIAALACNRRVTENSLVDFTASSRGRVALLR